MPKPACPDCGTELTPIRQSRTRRIALWCWKCERYLRLGEDREARRRALDEQRPSESGREGAA